MNQVEEKNDIEKEMIEEAKPKKAKVFGMVAALVFLVALVAGLTYALFEFNQIGGENNTLSTGTFVMEVDETTATEINLVSAYPVEDQEGLAQTPYTFTIRNTGSLAGQYRLRLVKDEASYPEGIAKADSSYIKYGLRKHGDDQYKIGFVDENDGVLITDVLLAPGEEETYSITVWIDSERDLPNSLFETKNVEFYGKVQLDAIQEGHSDYTTGQ